MSSAAKIILLSKCSCEMLEEFFFFKDCYKQKTKVGEGGSGILIRKMPWKVIDLRLVDWSQYTKGGMMNVLAWASR